MLPASDRNGSRRFQLWRLRKNYFTMSKVRSRTGKLSSHLIIQRWDNDAMMRALAVTVFYVLSWGSLTTSVKNFGIGIR
jgi:hypothetical protein